MVKPAPPLLLSLLLGALTVTLVTSQIFFDQRSGCPTECNYVYDPVCGSDGVSYPNLCFFTRANCKNTSVRAVKRGPCSVPDPCAFICDRMYNPMCGSDGVTYANPCVLLYFACYYANGLQPRHSGKCIVERPCPTSCPSDNEPVCGSDGNAYGNPCFLLLEACKGRLLTPTRNGPCNPPQRPCPKSCTSRYAPVCASDGNTYNNQCTLDATNCQGSITITKIYDGECVKTDTSKRNCPTNCPFIYLPVCGSDGKTYSNQCDLEVASCRDPTITKIYDTECVRHQRECPAFCSANYAPVCGSDGKTYGNQCALDATSCKGPTITKQSNGECGTPQRPCPDVCPEVYSPVCGTDGKTYDNDCALKAASCKNPSIILSDSGKCEERPTSTPRCPVSCSRLFEPVCGSNGVTYDNQCLLTRVTCRDPSITKTSDGPCAHPAAPAKGSGSGDSCVRKCSFTYVPVCGSDQVTYSNQCTFENAICKDPALTKRYDGTCR